MIHFSKRMTRRNHKTLLFVLCIFIFTAVLNFETAAGDEISWNDGAIQWWNYEQGLDHAWREGKPVILIIYTDWCPTCKKYSYVFQDERVIQESGKFVMVRMNMDEEKELSSKYAFDGRYIPKTIALHPGGSVMHEIYPQKNARYYIGTGADRLLKLMKDAYSRL
jgi:thiol-disulfide isomerase/thioredoxin